MEKWQATDDDLDIFGGNCGEQTETSKEASASEEVQGGGSSSHTAEAERPQWGAQPSLLFPSLGKPGLTLDTAKCSERDAEFTDAVVRLASLGFDPTKCHLALEAANGDE